MRKRLFTMWGWALTQVTYRQCSEQYIPRNHETDQIMTVLWEWGMEGALPLFCPSFGFQSAGFYHHCRLIVFQVTAELRRGVMGLEQGKNQTSIPVFTDIQPFFWNKSSPDCCKPVVNFQSSAKCILTIFANIFIAFMEDKIFRVPYPGVFRYHPNVLF